MKSAADPGEAKAEPVNGRDWQDPQPHHEQGHIGARDGPIAVELMNPEKYFYSYVYSNDMTASRIFRIGERRRVRAYVEIFNVMNNSTIFTRNETFGTQWYNPINLVDARRFQFGAQFDF